MTPPRPLRLPLQIGISGLWSLAQTAMAGALGLAMAVGLVRYYRLDATAQGHLPGWMVIAGLCSWSSIVLVPFALAHLVRGLRERPTDVVLSADGLAIEGGRFGGRVLRWDAIDADRCRIEVVQGTRFALWQALLTGPAFFIFLIGEMLWPVWMPIYGVFLLLRALVRGLRRGDAPARPRRWRLPHPWELRPFELRRLLVVDRSGAELVVGEARHDSEFPSLEAVLQSIRGVALRQRGGKGAPAEAVTVARALEVLTCPSCRAPVESRDAAVIPCGSCGAAVAVPDELATRIRAALRVADDRPAVLRDLPGLLAQPGAAAATTRLAVVVVPMLLAWPAAVVVARRLFAAETITPRAIGLLAVFASALVLACYFLGRSALVDRHALRVVALDFSARAPARAGAPATCRACAAPLPTPAADTSIVIACVYCRVDNVLGLDFRGAAAPLSDERRSLAEALARRTRSRRWWRALAVAALPLLAVSGWAMARVTGGAEDHGDFVAQACDGGDASACHVRAMDYDLGTGGVAIDHDHARVLYEQACRLGSVYTDCRGWAEAEPDDARRREAWAMTCDHGDPDACLHLGRMLRDGDGGAPDLAAAAARFGQTCDDRDHAGCNDLAVALWDGAGVAVDHPRAVALWATACAARDRFACFNLAGCYATGDGAPVDPARAAALYRQACDLGDDDACAKVAP